MNPDSATELQRLRRRAERERRAREEAEAIAERATRDLYERNRALDAVNHQLQSSEMLYRTLFESNPLPMYVVSRGGLRFLQVNAAAERHYEFSRAEFLGLSLHDIQALREKGHSDALWASIPDKGSYTGTWWHVTRSGRSIEVELTVYPLEWNSESAWLVVANDVTERRQFERDLRLRDQAIEASPQGFFIYEAQAPDYRVVYVNSTFERMVGLSRDRVVGAPLEGLYGELLTREDFVSLETDPGGGCFSRTVKRCSDSGEPEQWFDVQITPIRDSEDIVRHYVGLFSDISEQKSYEQALYYRAHHDELTELPNRVLLGDRLSQAIAVAKRQQQRAAVLYIDLDKFKYVNDVAGHEAGDQYLKKVIARIAGCIREGDTLARVGGDEFVVVAAGLEDEQTAHDMADRIQAVLEPPVTLGGQDFGTSASIGIALYPDHGGAPETLLKHADTAMYQAKQRGGHKSALFAPQMEVLLQQRVQIEEALKRAWAGREFELHYQPILDMRSGVTIGVEALLRWPAADDYYQSPDRFVPVAEENGLIVPLGQWVLDTACRDLAQLRRDDWPSLQVSVNISVVQLRQPDFTQSVLDALQRHGLPPSALTLEITESMLMTDLGTTRSVLLELQEKGVGLAIDDFGTGYSSLNYLRHLPVKRLKIDRSFIRDLRESRQAQEIVRTVAVMARSLGLESVAEGVEDDADLKRLLDYECQFVQGHLFSKAVPLDELKTTLSDPARSSATG